MSEREAAAVGDSLSLVAYPREGLQEVNALSMHCVR